jgi:DNA-directed RNA polymerase specialized sigma24 family protein
MREFPGSRPDRADEALWTAFSGVRQALLEQAAAVVGPDEAEEVVDEALVRTLEHPVRPAGGSLEDALARAVGREAEHHRRRLALQRQAEARADWVA